MILWRKETNISITPRVLWLFIRITAARRGGSSECTQRILYSDILELFLDIHRHIKCHYFFSECQQRLLQKCCFKRRITKILETSLIALMNLTERGSLRGPSVLPSVSLFVCKHFLVITSPPRSLDGFFGNLVRMFPSISSCASAKTNSGPSNIKHPYFIIDHDMHGLLQRLNASCAWKLIIVNS